MSTEMLNDIPTIESGPTQPLPLGHRMGELEITGVLGVGGFGIVYRAFDHALQRVVAIKEYMPSMLAIRRGDLTVSLRSDRYAATFRAGQSGFINEARLLAQFDHPGLIKVLRFWEDHGTAYMATPYYEGQTLKQRLAGGRALAEAEVLRLMAALLGALETLHRAQCFHRDIALDNILIQPDGRPVLLDFGAARKLIGDLVDDSTIMLKPGYAPIEQYTDDPAFRQGPWTDLYALGAVIHVLVSGELPPAAVVRSIQDSYVPLAGRALGYSQRLLQAADKALQVRIEDRPQNVVAFAALLGLQSNAPGQYSVPDVTPIAPAALPTPELEQEAVVAPAQSAESVEPAVAIVPEPVAEPLPASSPETATLLAPAQPVRRRWGAWALAAGAAVLLLGGGAFALLQSRQPVEVQLVAADSPQPSPRPATPVPTVAPVPTAAPASAVAVLPTPAVDVAEAAWLEARSLGTAAAYQDYLQRYVGGSHEIEARKALAEAVAREQALPSITPTPEAKPLAVKLQIAPWGEVYVNGSKRGVSPPLKSLSLAPGSYDIEIRNGTLTPFRTRIELVAGSSGNVIGHRFE